MEFLVRRTIYTKCAEYKRLRGSTAEIPAGNFDGWKGDIDDVAKFIRDLDEKREDMTRYTQRPKFSRIS